MLAPSLEVSRRTRAIHARETGYVPMRLEVASKVYNALAEGRLTALVVRPEVISLPGHLLSVFNHRAPRSNPLRLVMGQLYEDNYGLENGYRVLSVGLLNTPCAIKIPDEPTKCFGTASLRRGYMFMSNAPTHLEKVGWPFLDSSTVLLREPDRMVDDKVIPGAERLTRVAVMSAFDMPGIARHAQLVSIPRPMA